MNIQEYHPSGLPAILTWHLKKMKQMTCCGDRAGTPQTRLGGSTVRLEIEASTPEGVQRKALWI